MTADLYNFPLTHWRLMKTPPRNGLWNMALDEAILESMGSKKSKPTLRLFAWSPPCLSLGHAQPISDVNLEKLDSLGWNIVRRITGGRAILHTDELTYSVIGPYDEPRLAGGVLESYLCISKALLTCVRKLGIDARTVEQKIQSGESLKNKEPVCFEVPSNYEITSHGKKLIGSAQARKKKGILQHGTLPLYGDLTRILEVLNDPGIEENLSEPKQRILERATTVENVIGRRISWDEAVQSMIQAFEETLNITFIESEPTLDELKRTEELIKVKYSHPDWTGRI
jgi:lipoate-protein ligase A